MNKTVITEHAEIHFIAESGKTIKVTFDPKTGHLSMEAVDEDG